MCTDTPRLKKLNNWNKIVEMQRILTCDNAQYILKKFLLRGSFYSVEEYLDWTSMHDLHALYL